MKIEIRRLELSFTGLPSQGSPVVPAGTVARKDAAAAAPGTRQPYARAGLEAEALANEKLVQAGRMATVAISGRGSMLQRRDAPTPGGEPPSIAERIALYLTTQASSDLRVRLITISTAELAELVRKSVSGADLLRDSALRKIIEDWRAARTPSLAPARPGPGVASTPGSLPSVGGPTPGRQSSLGGQLGDFGRLLGRVPTSVALGDPRVMEVSAGRSGLQLSHERPGLKLSAGIGWDRVLGAEAAAGDLKFTASAGVLGGDGQKLSFGFQYGPDAPDLAALPRTFQPAGEAAAHALVNLPRFVSYLREGGVDELKAIPDAVEQARRIAGERDRKIPITFGLTAQVNRGDVGPPGVSMMGNLTFAWDVLKKAKAGADPASATSVTIPRGGGQPLDARVLAKLEGFFGRQLPQVRIHTGPAAEAAAAGLKAEAFTLGRDIYFGEGKFEPESKHGLGLLGHELTHVLQQEEGRAPGVRRAGADTSSLEREAETIARAVQTASSTVRRGALIIGAYRRTYRPAGGQPLANAERAALDTIATLGREACERILLAEHPSVLSGDRALPPLRMSFDVDLASTDHESVAQAWGLKMAETIVAAAQAPLASSAHREQAVQLAPNPKPSEVKAGVEIVKRMLAVSDYKPSMYSATAIITRIATQKPEVANAIFSEIQNWTIDGKTGPAVLQMIMGPLDESPGAARAMREFLLKKGITAFRVGRTQLSPQEKAGLAQLAGAKTNIVSKVRAWQKGFSGATRGSRDPDPGYAQREAEAELTALLPLIGVSSIDALVKLVDDLESRFRARAKLVALRMLDDNETLVLQEAARYTGAKGDASELVKAAKELSQVKNIVSQTEQRLDELKRQAADPLGGGMGTEPEYDRLSGIANKYRKELEVLTNLYSLQFPVLKAEGLDIEALANATPEQAQKLVLGKFHEVLENIAKTRHNINEGDLDAWALAPVVEATKEEVGVKGTPLEAIGDDAAAQARGGWSLKRLALAALAIGLGLLAAIPTGGSSLAAGVATAATVAGAGLAVHGIAESVKEYRAKSAARQSALDPALAISQEDPSLLWLGVDVVAGIFDLGMAYKALKGIGAAAKEVQAGKNSIEAVKLEAQRAAKMAEAEGKLHGSEEEFVERIVNRVETHVKLEDEVADLRRQTANPESVRRPADPEKLDAEMTARDGHKFERNRRERTWCRHSGDESCELDLGDELNAAVDKAIAKRDAKYAEMEQERKAREALPPRERAPKREPATKAPLDPKAARAAQKEATKKAQESLQNRINDAKEMELQLINEMQDIKQSGKQRLSPPEKASLAEAHKTRQNNLATQRAHRESLQIEFNKLEITPYDRARAYSYSGASAQEVVERARKVIEVPGQPKTLALVDEMSGLPVKKPSIDHVVSIDQMVLMDGWGKLRWPEQQAFLSRVENLRMMEFGANASKGGKSWAKWTEGRIIYGEKVWREMIAEERRLHGIIQKKIRTIVAGR